MAFYFIYFFLKIIFMWIIFKVFTEFVEILFLFSVLFFVFFFDHKPCGDLSSLARNWTHIPCIGKWCLNHWTVREVHHKLSSVQFSSVAQLCLTLCDTVNRSTPGLPVHHQLPEFTQTHVHRVSDASQPSHPPSSSSPPALNPSQHQGLFKWVSSLHQVAMTYLFIYYGCAGSWLHHTGTSILPMSFFYSWRLGATL